MPCSIMSSGRHTHHAGPQDPWTRNTTRHRDPETQRAAPEQGTDEPDNGGFVGKDVDDVGAALNLPVEA